MSLRYTRLGACSLAAVFLFSGTLNAQILGGSARQLTPGSWKVSAFYQGAQGQDLRFKVDSGGPCTGGGAFNPSFPCGSGGYVVGDGAGGAGIVKLLVQPWDNVQYYVSAGLGDYTLSVPNGAAAANVLTGDRPGSLYSAGFKAVLLPDTIVSPAIALDASLGWQRYRFNEVRPAATAAAGQIDQRLDLYLYQVALETSHKFDFEAPTKFSVEPYGGLKWLRSNAYLKDLQGGGRIGGIQDSFSPFLGIQVPVYEHETVFAEASFVDGYQYAAGAQIRFK